MSLYKWVRDEVNKLSYVDKTEYKNASFKIYYTNNEQQKFKKLPYRADKNQLKNVLNSIKEELNVREKKREEFKKHLKPMIINASWVKDKGEIYGRENKTDTNKNN